MPGFILEKQHNERIDEKDGAAENQTKKQNPADTSPE